MGKNRGLEMQIVYPLDMIRTAIYEAISAISTRLPITLESRDVIDAMVLNAEKITDDIFNYDPISGGISKFINPVFSVSIQMGKPQSNVIDLNDACVRVGIAISKPIGVIDDVIDDILKNPIFDSELLNKINGICELYGEIVANQLFYKIFVGLSIMERIIFDSIVMIETSSIAQLNPIDPNIDPSNYAATSIKENKFEDTLIVTTAWNNIMNVINPIKLPISNTDAYNLVTLHPLFSIQEINDGVRFQLDKITLLQTIVNPNVNNA